MESTLGYYEKHAGEFSADTLATDMSCIQESFLAHLQPGAHILDLGCGAGRDALIFLERGFAVTATDGSAAMCREAEKNTGLAVRQLLFSELDYVDAFDAVWACSSLLHVPSAELRGIFTLVHRTLKENGIFYFSFKYGTGEGERKGRYFTDLTEETMRPFIEGLFTTIKVWTTGDARPGRNHEKWLNVIARKC